MLSRIARKDTSLGTIKVALAHISFKYLYLRVVEIEIESRVRFMARVTFTF